MIDLTGYKLTFDEEFNSRSISQNGTGTTWADIRPGSRLNANADIGFGNSAFVDAASGIDPFSVQNGALHITAVRTDAEVAGPGDWASGLISSRASFAQTYGYFEMRAQLPAEAGVWPAFWMLPADGSWPPELDVLEAYGDTNLWQYVHSVAGDVQVWSSHANMTAGYHSYGVEWGPTTISFYFDGERVGAAQTPVDFHKPMYLLADLAIQRGVAGTTDAAKQMQIDYIRAYSADPHATAVDLAHVSSPDGADTGHLYGATAASHAEPPPSNGQASVLSLRVSGDHYAGSPQFQVFVDGTAVGSVQTVQALHVLGQWQQFDFSGPFAANTAHAVEVRFLNDAWDGYGGGEGHDRNLYVQSLTLNGTTENWTAATGNVAPWSTDSAAIATNGSIVFGHAVAGPPPQQPVTPPSPPPESVPTAPSAPGGSASLSVKVSGDHYTGAPQFQVFVDGAQIGQTQTVEAVHVLGQWDTFDFDGAFAAGTPHQVEVRFVNDAWDGYGGGEGHDRNLYVESVSLNAHTALWTAATGNVAPWSIGSAALATNGGVLFDLF
ncbi:carbohydrate-binding domain-containing protein [Bosea lathyri]|uniref:Ca-dependent carbohydrate-binding module xylan-binding n=1 Tax=Bosea lathyri TaxID=1036778 RepID=A0A1H6BXJ7_9HYPH|nr:carbohydrate-binding domain-containing protein [Bosea lathyri]SEG65408.1 Ca-dependent carbohydrate-binding module xylan-binding [Bosea lathyri]